MADVGTPKGRAYDMPVAIASPMVAMKGISKGIGRNLGRSASFGVWEAADAAQKALQSGRSLRQAGRYGSQLGRQNPYLAGNI